MRIDAFLPGKKFAPLDVITVRDLPGDSIEIMDSHGRTYVQAKSSEVVHLTLGGAAGAQRVRALSGNTVIEEILIQLEPRTRLREDRGAFTDLFRMLELTLKNDEGPNTITYKGKLYTFFIRWLRDHVHTMKGSKYWFSELKSGIDIYSESQREDGMIWDNIYDRGPDPNYWDYRFSEGDFIRPFENGLYEFKRIPVENDVEYLFVEGIYFTWKATGDDAWMATHLDAAIRALQYSITDPYRWSEKYGLLKRGYTIDTWDFQNDYDRIIEGDIMRVRPGETRFGIMFGDNTGYIAACRQLSEMLERVGRKQEAPAYLERADTMLNRLNELTWRGTHYLHHLRENPEFQPDFGVDTDSQISLSNTYSMNRGIGLEKCRAILSSYRHLRDHLPEGAPGEWYMIYPPFEKGFDGDAGKWHYMNGGVSAICAGEMARAAFFNGEEAYGADILIRLRELGARYRDQFQEAYQGSVPTPPNANFQPLDLRSVANCDPAAGTESGLASWSTDPENDLSRVAVGAQVYEGIPFELLDPAAEGRRGLIGISKRSGFAESASVQVGRATKSIALLHTTSGASSLAGTLRWVFADGTQVHQMVVQGSHVLGWWLPEPPEQHRRRHLAVGWKGANPRCPYLGLSLWVVDSPKPDLELSRLEFEAAPDGAVWGIFAVTVSDQPAFLPPTGLSYGIPKGWGAAAVVYAMAEGLAGVVDRDTAYKVADFSPRWAATEVTEADICLHYPASGGYVAYRYRRVGEHLEYEITGSGDTLHAHILLPEGQPARTVLLDDAAIPFTIQQVAASHYVAFEMKLTGIRHVRLELEVS